MPYDTFELRSIYYRTGGRCYHCRKKLAWRNYGAVDARGAWEVDHSNPRARGGTDYLRNLVPSCVPCNRSKGSLRSRQYQDKIMLDTVLSHPERFPELFKKRKRRKKKRIFGLRIADASRIMAPRTTYPVSGAYVGSVKPNSTAKKAGLLEGDIIIEANGRPIITAIDLENVLKGLRKGSVAFLVIRRGDATFQISAVT